MHPDMIGPYAAMRDEIQRRTGMRLYVSSDYRTREEQESLLKESEAGVAAQLGCSEHEAGLALDVYVPYFAGEGFLQSRAGRLTGEISCNYGYVIRYPLDKEGITGIAYEPWHLRYVGEPHARLMTDAGLTLEEYIDSLSPDVWCSAHGYLISRQRADSLCAPAGFDCCEVSFDNTGYCILTVKM